MSKAVLCPVCKGSGQVYEQSQLTTTVPLEKTCYGCEGKGWVEVGDAGDAGDAEVMSVPNPFLKPMPTETKPVKFVPYDHNHCDGHYAYESFWLG